VTLFGTSIAIVLGIFKIIEIIKRFIESKRRLSLIIELNKYNYEAEKGDQVVKLIKVKILNKTNYNISIDKIIFKVSRDFLSIPFNVRSIRFLSEDEILHKVFKPGESRTFTYDMSYIHSDGSLNIDILKDKKLKNHCIRARIVYPDNSFNDSKEGVLIKSILTN
jgi:hypothetical protein